MCATSPGSSGLSTAPQAPRTVDWLLTSAWIVTGDSAMTTIRGGALAIHGDQVVALGPTKEILTRFRGLREIDLGNHLLAPGLINTHTHAAMTCFRGLGDDLPLTQWLQQVIFPAEAAHVAPAMVYWGTLLACVEMLQNGITTFCDGYFFEEAAARAVLDAGIRAVLGQGVLDFPAPDQPDPVHARERVAAFLEAFPDGQGRLRPSLFCHAPYTCGPQTLQWVKQLCRDRGLLFQTHLSETTGEVADLMKKHGERPVFYLDRLGILDGQTLCAHAIWLEPQEIERVALRQTGIAHTTESNMKLGSGVARIPDMLAAGIKIGLGTDGCASNNNLDLFGEMDKTAKLHKVMRHDPTICSARQVLRMATLGGAGAIAWDNEIGSLEVGKQADVMAIDLDRPHLTPLYDPISHLVYAVSGSDVRHVWVAGRQVVADGKVLTVDVAEVCAEVQRFAAAISRSQADVTE
jgi:5-methylthioadenosine/S-adenosylhomocysteine deaminase